MRDIGSTGGKSKHVEVLCFSLDASLESLPSLVHRLFEFDNGLFEVSPGVYQSLAHLMQPSYAQLLAHALLHVAPNLVGYSTGLMSRLFSGHNSGDIKPGVT